MNGSKTQFTRKPQKGPFVVTWDGHFLPAAEYDPKQRHILVEGGR